MRWQSWSMLMVSLVLSTPSRAAEKASCEEEPIYQGKTLAEWIGDLKDTEFQIQRTAVESLGVFGPRKEVVSALTTALKINDAGAVLPAAQTLGKFGVKAKEALPELRMAYKKLSAGPPTLAGNKKYSKEYLSMFAHARQAVVEALILIDDHPGSELAPILLEALKTDNADKRREIVIKLGKLGPEAAKTTVPALIAVLADTNEQVLRQRSGILYGTSNDSPEQKIRTIRLEAVKSLARIGPHAKPALHTLTLAMKIAAPEKDTRVQQMEVSDKLVGSANAKIHTISFTVVTGDKAMLAACTEALSRIRPEAEGTVGALRLALRDLDEGVRWAALCALLENGQDMREVVPILLNFVRDKDAALRRLAVEALGKSETDAKQILPVLTAALKDKDASVRDSTAKTLGEMGTKAKPSTPALIEALKDAETQVRQDAAEALGKIGAADDKAISALIAALSDKEDDVIKTAAEALSKFGVRGKAAIPLLLPRLHNSHAKKRAGFCILLSKFGPLAKEAIPVLEKMAREDSDRGVRLIAYTALAKIDSSRVKEAVRRLADALSDNEGSVVEVALECLDYLGSDARDALPALRSLRDRSHDNLAKDLDEVITKIENTKNDSGKR